MTTTQLHSFHIPVLGIGYSIDTPIKVARFGISSVLSIMDDRLLEKMREYHSINSAISFMPIHEHEEDFRARRITAYLNMMHQIIDRQMLELKALPFEADNDLTKYFELLPETSTLKQAYLKAMNLPHGSEKTQELENLKEQIKPGSIDVNIMSKVDKLNTDVHGNVLPPEFSDASSAFRGFANSVLQSSVVFSAGYNPRLYAYLEHFTDLYSDTSGHIKKKIILKVSDFRSALVQGKILAKKGLWISEFRIESGLNCGGHAFATDGLLLGPILEEFKSKRSEISNELWSLCLNAMTAKGMKTPKDQPELKITVQGGIGTARENEFLIDHYKVDGTGWGSPFLLVPEATNVDEHTLHDLATASKEDYFMSDASPLGIPFNNFRRSTSEQQRIKRAEKGRPGSPCYKKFLSSDTEFTPDAICTASREYQHLKINQLKERQLPADQFEKEMTKIIEKDCLCEGLGAAVLLKDGMPLNHKLSAVTICPGPNLAYFSGIFSLAQMVAHIYGKINILNSLPRPNMFVNELHLYVDYLKKQIDNSLNPNPKQVKYLQTFRANLLEGINYYHNLVNYFKKESEQYIKNMCDELDYLADVLGNLEISTPKLAVA